VGKYGPMDDDGPEEPRRASSGSSGGSKYGPTADDPVPVTAPPGTSRGWGDTLSSWGQTAVDFGTAAGNSATFGLDVRRDALAGWLAGDYPSYSAGVEAEQAIRAKQRARSPYVSIAGDVTGAVALPGMGGAGLAARLGGKALARGIGYGVEGIGIGALQGAGNTYTGKPLDYLTNATTGGLMGGVLGGLGGAAFGPRGGMQSSARAPSLAEQERATDMAYNTYRALPARYTPASFAQAGQDAGVALRREGHFNAPTTEGGSPVPFRAVEHMLAPPTAVNPVTGASTHISPRDVDVVRKMTTGKRIKDLDEWQKEGAQTVRNRIDDWVLNPPPGSVVPGTEAAAAQAGGIYKTARDLHGGTMRTEMVDDLITNAQRQAQSTHSGLNERNQLQIGVRQNLKTKAGESAFSKAGFNPAEIAEFERFSRGQGKVSSMLGYLDKYLGGGGGLGAMVAGGVGGQYLGGDGSGLAQGLGTSAAGLGLRMLGNRRAANDINQLRDMVARRNPLYAQRAATAPLQAPPGGAGVANVRDALTTELIKQGYFQTR
jgi:hypothetical protein